MRLVLDRAAQVLQDDAVLADFEAWIRKQMKTAPDRVLRMLAPFMPRLEVTEVHSALGDMPATRKRMVLRAALTAVEAADEAIDVPSEDEPAP